MNRLGSNSSLQLDSASVFALGHGPGADPAGGAGAGPNGNDIQAMIRGEIVKMATVGLVITLQTHVRMCM